MLRNKPVEPIAPDVIHRRKAVTKIVGLSRSTVDRLEAAGKFPKRVVLGARAVGYRQSEITQWLNSRTTKGAA